jgi:hypothetical protein
MRVLSIYMVISSLAVLGLACSKRIETAPENPEAVVPAEAPAPAPAAEHPQPEADPGFEHKEPTTEVYLPSEPPPPMPTDHRLRLGIDGDPGFEQQVLTPEELAAARAAGEQSPEPSYEREPSEPSYEEEPDDVAYGDDTVDTVYVGGRREPVRRKRAREHSPAEPRPANQPHEPTHANPPHAGPHR